ncbi:MAG: ABC transporter substrate-binding protein, partial [Planctomycetaceae bacterium]|nr:ABC transporter substrate-binding protein [Planctomycetaceae bacterium]
MKAARLLCILILCCLLAAAARADDPLYLQPPYDEIVLDESNGRAILRVQPFNFPGRRMPSPSDRKEDLEFELVDRPGEKFAVPWVNVADIRFFESLVLAEADAKVKEGRFDEAQPYFQFLQANHKETPGLSNSIETLLYVQVGAAFRAQRYDEALALLVELYGRNPARQGVSTAYERVTAELVKGHIAAGRYAAARGLLRNLSERYPATKTTTVATYETQLSGEAAALLEMAKAAKAASKPREAYEAVHKAIALWPTLAGASELARSLHKEYPVIAVGVVSPLTGAATRRTDDWAAFRTSRLLATPLVAPSADGAGYSSSLGDLARGEDPRQIALKMRDDLTWAAPPRKLSGQDVARCLMAAADPKHPQFDPLWASVLGGVTASGSDVQIDFLRPQPLPEAWLVRPIWWEGGPPACGPYQLESHANGQSRFVRQSGYFAAAGLQIAEITERTFPDSTAALAALKRGEIGLIDRLSPWDVAAATATSGVSVRRYAGPTVHVLIPNPNKPLVASRTMRRALLYGIDREGILRRGLVGGLDLPGCDVVSGPLPRGAAGDR